MPILQIHVPAYNEERNIQKTIEGLLNQSFTDFHLTIHDNKSTDATLEICRKLAKSDSRILIDVGAVNVGAIMQQHKARCGFDSKYISLRSANDAIHPDYFQHTVALLESDPSISLAYSHGGIFNQSIEDAVPANIHARIDSRNLDPVESACEVMGKYTTSFPLWGVYRRTAYEKCRPYPFRYGGDHIFVAEMALYGAIAPTDLILDYRHEPPHDWRKMSDSNAASQLEEHVKGIPANSYYYGLKQNLPFIDMAWGHIEMFSLARIDDSQRNAVISRCIDIFKARFGVFMNDECSRFWTYLWEILNGLDSVSLKGTPNIFIWLNKAKAELDKLRILALLPAEQIFETELQIGKLLNRFER